jgi:GAF domain-containing protein
MNCNPVSRINVEKKHSMLQQRDQLLEATAKATNVLLTLDNFDKAVHTALKIIGEGTGCDYVIVLENMFESSSPLPSSCDFIYEWATPGFLPLSIAFGSTSLPAELLGLNFMQQYFLEGEGFGGLREIWNEPLRSALASVQVQSSYAVPIRVSKQWWGVLGLDYCQSPVQMGAAEISVLMAIADCIGSAIQRDRTQKLILQAEQNRAMELAKANHAMRHSIDWLARDPDMDAFLGHLLQEFAAQFEAQDAQIVLYNPQDQTFHTSVGLIDGEITAFPPHTSKIPAATWRGWEVLLQSPKPRLISLETEPHLFLPDCLAFYRKRGNRGIVCTLLRQDEQPLGFIEFAYRNRDTFSENELELVQSLAQQATLGMRIK